MRPSVSRALASAVALHVAAAVALASGGVDRIGSVALVAGLAFSSFVVTVEVAFELYYMGTEVPRDPSERWCRA